MRLHIDDVNGDDPEKRRLCREGVDVYLDGIKQPLVIMADEEAGVIERYVTDKTRGFGSTWLTERVIGKVEIMERAK